MMGNRTIVVASTNGGKINEIVDLLDGFPVSIKTLADFGPIPFVEEDGLTFDDNAYKKSSFTARVLGFPAIADDSGLVVPALNGAPGVCSARYGGVGLTDVQRCNKLLHMLRMHSDRRAYFKCVISIAVPAGAAITYEGRCDGTITKQVVGTNGFGYDPIFFCDKFNKTFAQLFMKEKSEVSHRGIALKILAREFGKVLNWLDLQMPVASSSCCQGRC